MPPIPARTYFSREKYNLNGAIIPFMYKFGGETDASSTGTASVDKFNTQAETWAAATNGLTVAQRSGCAFTNKISGYILGGSNSSNGDNFTVCKYTFSGETSANISNYGSVAIRSSVGYGNTTIGIVSGGYSSCWTFGQFKKFTYAGETWSNSISAPQASGYNLYAQLAASTASKGYIYGGSYYNGTTTIYANTNLSEHTFSSDTVTATTAVTGGVSFEANADYTLNNTTIAYYPGSFKGDTGATNAIRKLVFATTTMTTLSAVDTVTKYAKTGKAMSNGVGVVVGGSSPRVANTRKFTIATETMAGSTAYGSVTSNGYTLTNKPAGY